MNEQVIIGKTVSTHGIKGELKVISDFDYIDKAFKVGMHITIKNTEHIITGIRYHKQYILMEIDNLKNINLVLEYVGYNIYVAKGDLGLEEDEYLLKELIGAQVIEDNKILGEVTEIVMGLQNNFVKVRGESEFLIPLIPVYIEGFDKNNKILSTNNAKDLII